MMAKEEFSIDTITNSKDGKAITDLANSIENGKKSFVNLICALESLLTSKDSSDRAKGVRVLGTVMKEMSTLVLTQEQLTPITEFYIDRLKDNMVVQNPLLDAVSVLLHQKNLASKDAEKFMRSFFLEIHCQSLPALDRRNCYKIIEKFCQNFPSVYQEMYEEVALGFLNAAQGERDPRNLLMVFSLLTSLASSHQLKKGSLADELFELPAAYFPIDFIPPANDEYGITASDLVLSLRSCLAATSAWSAALMDLLMEKMESDSLSAKLDAYSTLSSCKGRLTSVDVAPFGLLVWGHIRRECVEGQEEHLTTVSLVALRDFVSMLFTEVCDAEQTNSMVSTALYEPFIALLPFASECLAHLSAPGNKLMVPASRMLQAMVAGSLQATEIICAKVLPLLCEQILKGAPVSGTTVSVLVQFLKDASTHPSTLQASGVLASCREQCASAVTLAITNDSSRLPAVGAVSIGGGVWTEECQQRWAEQIADTVLLQPDDKEFREAAFSALGSVGTACYDVIIDKLLCKAAVPGDCTGALLGLMELCCTGPERVKLCLEKLWGFVCLEPNAMVLETMKKIVDRNVESKDTLLSWGGERKVISFIANATEAKTDQQILEAAAALCRSFISLEGCSGQALCSQMLSGSLCTEGGDSLLATSLLPVTINNCQSSAHLVFAVDGLLCATKDLTDTAPLPLESLLCWALCPSVPSYCRDTSALILASIVLKLHQGDPLNAAVSLVENTVNECLKSQEMESKKAAVVVWARVCQALQMRRASCASVWMEKMISLLSDPEVGSRTADCYKFLLQDDHYALNSSVHSNFRLFFKQRVFGAILPVLVEKLQSSAGPFRHYHLIAIAGLLQTVGSLHLQPFMKEVISVVVEGIRCNSESSVVMASISTLYHLLYESTDTSAEYLAPHISALLSALVSLANDRHSQCLDVRKQAALCLELLSHMPSPIILPYKEETIRNLKPALNDHKRIVRKAVGDARCSWMLLQAAGT